jgi:hypothetical protein
MADRPAGLWQDTDFRRYTASRVLSLAGTITTYVALPVLVYRLSGSALLTATLASLEAAPYVVFGLLAGALADRRNRKRVMVGADLVSAVVVGSVPLAQLLGLLTLPQLMVVGFLGPAVAVFFDGAVFGAVPALVGRDRIGQANSYVWSVQGLVDTVMTAVVGIALAAVQPAALLVVDAASFVASATLIGRISRPLQGERVHGRLGVRQLGHEVREGLGYLARHAGVRTMAIIGFTQCAAGGGFVAPMVVWCDRQLGVGTQGLRFGIVYSAWAVGGLVASLALPRLLGRMSAAQVALLALPVSAVLAVTTPLWGRWWVAAAWLFGWSIAYTLVAVNGITYRQQVTPDHLLGRVNTAGRMLSWGLGWTGGAMTGGAVGAAVGLHAALLLMTAVSFVGVAVAWTSPLRTELRRVSEADAVA